MRTALLAAVKRTATGELRAELELGGRSVLAWQVNLVRALGCERIICLCEAPHGEVLALQKRVETEGGAFHAVRTNIQIASLVRADDELVMLLDGLVADRANVFALTGFDNESSSRLTKGIATIRSAHSLAISHPDDFERIDRERHWAGLAVTRASQVHKLADFPPDSEPMSLLLRLCLQARVETREISADDLESGRWMLASDHKALTDRELALVKGSAGMPPWTGPGRALAATFVRRIAPRWLEKGSEISVLVGGFLLISSVGVAGLGMGPVALAIAAAGAFVMAVGEAWASLRKTLWSESDKSAAPAAMVLLSDLLAAVTVAFANGLTQPGIAEFALPLIAIGLARHLGGAGPEALAAFWRDRTLHLVLLEIAAGAGFLSEALALFALGAVAQLLLREWRN